MPDDKPVLMASNRSYRYGDGLFETMKVLDGKIRLSELHFERLLSSLSLLKYQVPALLTIKKIQQEIISLCQKNSCEDSGRVRLSIFRGNGGINDEDKTLQYLIESWPLNKSLNQLNENGLVIDIYPEVIKSTDKFSNIKSANFLPYSLAALYAKENKLNDCLILNSNGNIADSTIANLFIIKGDSINTPGLNDGCISGVMRKFLLKELSKAGINIIESSIGIEDLHAADEVFLTNAIYGIRWVKQFGNTIYGNVKIVDIYSKFIKTIHA